MTTDVLTTARPYRQLATGAFVYLIAGLTAFSALTLLLVLLHVDRVVDDAYISYIYARSLADGKGFTYADGARVEGYTDFLWVLLVGGAFKAGIRPEPLAQTVGFLSGIGLIASVWFWSQRLSAARRRFRFAPLLLASMVSLSFWSLAGLEEVPFAALIFGATTAVTLGRERSHFALAGFIYLLAALLHPDAVVFYVVALVFVGRNAPQERLQAVGCLLGTFSVPFSVYWSWRWLYFGYFMPNTFYAKNTASWTQFGQGARYLTSEPQVTGLLVVLLLLSPCALRRLFHRRETMLLLMQICAWLVYVMWAGGDALWLHRLMVPILAPLTVLIQESVALVWRGRTHPRSQRRVLLLCSLIVVYTFGVSLLFSDAKGLRRLSGPDTNRANLGRWFDEHAAANDVVAVSAAGEIPYFSHRPAIDMLGLNNTHIAHDGHIDDSAPVGHKRYDADYVLAQRPSFIVLNTFVKHGRDVMPTNNALLARPELSELYSNVCLTDLPGHDVILARNDRAGNMASSGLLEIASTCVMP